MHCTCMTPTAPTTLYQCAYLLLIASDEEVRPERLADEELPSLFHDAPALAFAGVKDRRRAGGIGATNAPS